MTTPIPVPPTLAHVASSWPPATIALLAPTARHVAKPE